MDLNTIISILVIILGIICIFFGIQITMSSKGKFKIVIILFYISGGLIILREILRLTLLTNIEDAYKLSTILNLVIITSILIATLIMRGIIKSLERDHKTGYKKEVVNRKINNIKKEKTFSQKTAKNIKNKGSYMNDEGYLVLQK